MVPVKSNCEESTKALVNEQVFKPLINVNIECDLPKLMGSKPKSCW